MKETQVTKTIPRALILRIIDEAYDKTAWHGPNLRGSLRRVPVEQACWRPQPGRHNIAEIAVHCAYWKYAVRRRILGGKRGSFPIKGSNWFEVPARLDSRQWREYLVLLNDEHKALRTAIETATASQLAGPPGKNQNPATHVYGVALHDTYHAGQIRTIKVLYGNKAGRRTKKPA